MTSPFRGAATSHRPPGVASAAVSFSPTFLLLITYFVIVTSLVTWSSCDAKYVWKPQGRFGKRQYDATDKDGSAAAKSANELSPTSRRLTGMIERLLSVKDDRRPYSDLDLDPPDDDVNGSVDKGDATPVDKDYNNYAVKESVDTDLTSSDRSVVGGGSVAVNRDVICKFIVMSRSYRCVTRGTT